MPSAPVEAAIALSIVFLCVEIIHAQQGRPGITFTYPWIVAFAFGLLRGLGSLTLTETDPPLLTKTNPPKFGGVALG